MKKNSSELQKEVDVLKERNWKLAREKSHLKTISYLYNKLSEVKGLKEVLKQLFHLIMDLYGSTSITIYYLLLDTWYSYSLTGQYQKARLTGDTLALAALEKKEVTSVESTESETSYVNLTLPKNSTTQNMAIPLIVQDVVIGIIKLEDIIVIADQTIEELIIFLQYAALVLHNEISNYLRLQESYERLKESKQNLEEKVIELTESEKKLLESLEERDILLKEIHHRVKNNLQVIASLIQLQSSNMEDKKIKEQFKTIKNRIKSMGLIHEKLYQSENLSRINFSSYIKELTGRLLVTYGEPQKNIQINYKIEKSIYFNIDTAIPCGLILNEIISNAVKYAFPGNKKGKIEIDFSENSRGLYKMIIKDNGIGLPAGVDFKNKCGLGLKLIEGLVAQIQGRLELNRKGGTCYTLLFSKIEKE